MPAPPARLRQPQLRARRDTPGRSPAPAAPSTAKLVIKLENSAGALQARLRPPFIDKVATLLWQPRPRAHTDGDTHEKKPPSLPPSLPHPPQLRGHLPDRPRPEGAQGRFPRSGGRSRAGLSVQPPPACSRTSPAGSAPHSPPAPAGAGAARRPALRTRHPSFVPTPTRRLTGAPEGRGSSPAAAEPEPRWQRDAERPLTAGWPRPRGSAALSSSSARRAEGSEQRPGRGGRRAHAGALEEERQRGRGRVGRGRTRPPVPPRPSPVPHAGTRGRPARGSPPTPRHHSAASGDWWSRAESGWGGPAARPRVGGRGRQSASRPAGGRAWGEREERGGAPVGRLVGRGGAVPAAEGTWPGAGRRCRVLRVCYNSSCLPPSSILQYNNLLFNSGRF